MYDEIMLNMDAHMMQQRMHHLVMYLRTIKVKDSIFVFAHALGLGFGTWWNWEYVKF